jgi:hypothetical protein
LLDGTQLVEETPFPANRTIRKPRENLRELVQTLSYNITLSLQSVDGLVYLTPEDTLVKQWAFESIYMYNRMPLVITYATLLGAGLLAIVIGAYSFVINKMSVKPGFLLFMMTTRNRTLDELARGGSLDSEDLSKDLLKVKVKYGELVQGSLSDFGRSSGHAGFGIKGQVTDLDRRRAYD